MSKWQPSILQLTMLELLASRVDDTPLYLAEEIGKWRSQICRGQVDRDMYSFIQGWEMPLYSCPRHPYSWELQSLMIHIPFIQSRFFPHIYILLFPNQIWCLLALSRGIVKNLEIRKVFAETNTLQGDINKDFCFTELCIHLRTQ